MLQSDAGWEEYYDYIFPDDETDQANQKLLGLAKMFMAQKADGESDDNTDSDEEADESSSEPTSSPDRTETLGQGDDSEDSGVD